MYVVSGYDNEKLYSTHLVASDVNFIVDMPDRFKCTAKFRYRQTDSGVTVEKLADGDIKVIFDEPNRSITPGQAVVLYDGETVIGGATIDDVFFEDKRLDYLG